MTDPGAQFGVYDDFVQVTFVVGIYDYFYSGKPQVYVPCVAYGDRAERIAKYFKQGDQIGMSGRLKSVINNRGGTRNISLRFLVQDIDYVGTLKRLEEADLDIKIPKKGGSK